ncbi:MAG: FHA domain-containing protein [Beijerinckiaceae bacterium]
MSDGSTITKIAVSTVADNEAIRVLSSGSETFPVTVGLLLDRGAGRDNAAFARLKKVIKEILDTPANFASYGLWTFATDIKRIAAIGTPPDTTALALESVHPNGSTFELLRSIDETTNEIASANSRRKVLIVLSDGASDDQAYTVPEVSKKLKDAGIHLYAVISQGDPEAVTAAQGLRRLSEETGGEFFKATAKSWGNVSKALTSHILRDGYVTFVPSDKKTKIEVTLSNNKVLTGFYEPPSVTVVTKTDASDRPDRKETGQTTGEQAEAPVSGKPYSILSPFLDWLRATTLLQRLGAGVTAVLAVVFLFTWSTRRAKRARQLKAATSEPAASATISELKPILAWLEFLDGNESKETIHAGVTRIGRQGDNDIVLRNSSVHRSHAVLKQEPSGTFIIVDMDTENGVFVNGARVKSTRLRDGDTIELGDVRMRFHTP